MCTCRLVPDSPAGALCGLDYAQKAFADEELNKKLVDAQSESRGIDPKSLWGHKDYLEVWTLTKYMKALARNIALQKKEAEKKL